MKIIEKCLLFEINWIKKDPRNVKSVKYHLEIKNQNSEDIQAAEFNGVTEN